MYLTRLILQGRETQCHLFCIYASCCWCLYTWPLGLYVTTVILLCFYLFSYSYFLVLLHFSSVLFTYNTCIVRHVVCSNQSHTFWCRTHLGLFVQYTYHKSLSYGIAYKFPFLVYQSKETLPSLVAGHAPENLPRSCSKWKCMRSHQVICIRAWKFYFNFESSELLYGVENRGGTSPISK